MAESDSTLTIVLFGSTGNLSKTKIMPSLWYLYQKGLLPDTFQVIGLGRRALRQEDFRIFVVTSLGEQWNDATPEQRDDFVNRFCYIAGSTDNKALFVRLKGKLQKTQTGNILVYLATLPTLYEQILEQIRENQVLQRPPQCWVRVMIEKPFGTDLVSSQSLNHKLTLLTKEIDIFRIDHYLAKETVQNILAFRFANGVFEHLWSSKYIDQIQITYAESGGVEGREEFYNQVGIVRDVVQNHILQLLSILMMDEPSVLEAVPIQKQRLSLLSTVVVDQRKQTAESCIFGRYTGTKLNPNVPSAIALKLAVKNDRWRGVPVFIRAGKAFKTSVIEAQIVFKEPLNRMFAVEGQLQQPNLLTIRIQPNEGIALTLQLKSPGLDFALQSVPMSFCYKSGFAALSLVEAYSKVLFDAIHGNTSLFIDSKGADACWRIVEPLLQKETEKIVIHDYEMGSWGPAEFNNLIAGSGQKWIEPDLNICSF